MVGTWLSSFKTAISARSSVTLVQMPTRRQLALNWEEKGLWSLTWFGFRKASINFTLFDLIGDGFWSIFDPFNVANSTRRFKICFMCLKYLAEHIVRMSILTSCRAGLLQDTEPWPWIRMFQHRCQVDYLSIKIKKYFCFRNDPYYEGKKGMGGCGEECQCRPFTRSHFTAVRPSCSCVLLFK